MVTIYLAQALRLFDELDAATSNEIADLKSQIQDLQYQLKVSEAKLSTTRRLLASSERQRIQALSLLDTNQYRNR